MWKFILGVLMGGVLAFGYVRLNIDMPSIFQLPGLLRGNLVATATVSDLYDLNADPGARVRALEVHFDNQARAAAQADADWGHPYLTALHRARAAREARELRAAWSAYDAVLAKPGLREGLVRKHGAADDAGLKRAMLAEDLAETPFLAAWLERAYGVVPEESLPDLLAEVSRLQAPASSP